jgi:hypothetical protein
LRRVPEMPPLVDLPRLVHLLRRGPAGPRLQALAGIGLVLLAGVGVIVWLLWRLIVLLLLFGCGVYLVRRALLAARSSS